MPFRTILHPTDFSELSAHALGLAVSLARDYDARLVVLHVVAPPLIAFAEGAVQEGLPELTVAARERLQALPVARPEGTVERRVVQGDPMTEIQRTVEETQADLIVMGSSGRSGLERLLLGDIADQVVRHASCPVLLTRGPVPEKGAEQPTEPVLELSRP